MGVMSTSQFVQNVTPGLRKVFYSDLKGIPKEFRQIVNVIGEKPGGQAGRNFYEDLRMASFGSATTKAEGAGVTYDEIEEDDTVRYDPYTFGLGFRITMEMKQDSLYGVFEKLTGELAQAAAHQMEVQGFRPWNSAFVTTGGGLGLTVQGYQNEALIATSHTLTKGGTYANRASTDLDLSQTALEAGMDNMENCVNESGMPTPANPSLVCIPPGLKWVAKELLESELKPYTGDNEVNALRGEGLKHMMVHYFSDPDMWIMTTPKAKHDVNVWLRLMPEITVGDDFDSGDAKVKVVFRIASGHGDWRGIYGSLGV